MAQLRDDLVGQPIGLLDSDSGGDLNIEKAVDITKDCPHRDDPERKILLLYTTCVKDQIVRIVYCDDDEGHGVKIHWHIHDLDDLSQEVCVNFPWYAERFGLTPEQLRGLVLRHRHNDPLVSG